MNTSYMFILDYGNRSREKFFILDLLQKFDQDLLTGISLFINNNPYNLEMYLFLNFQGEQDDIDNFELWLRQKYPHQRRIYNYFIRDLLHSVNSRGYNFFTLTNDSDVDLCFETYEKGFFQIEERSTQNVIYKGGLIMTAPRIFLSHSSKDKVIVDVIFNKLKQRKIDAWYDKYEIDPGDSITDKVNEGLSKCTIGVMILSKNFFNEKSGWPKNEMNFFLSQRMRTNKKNFICINLDMQHEDLPPLLQDYRYIDYNEPDSIDQLVTVLHRNI
ncbi:toll/interleukin-1 receptor domain-containing protein [Priestia aryabhattai]|uniref:toll/interleukin-1 receptor domain-containing protein n=1 Tax=Priestia aryabhattai TaxID=412384 RepID=UPI0030C9346F